MNYSPNYKGKQKQPDPTMLEVIVVGIFKLLWFLITLPFKGLKKSTTGRLLTTDRNYIVAQRHEIESLLGSENVIELKHAIMEADKLVDWTFIHQGFAGETFADRLRSAQSKIDPSIYNQLWEGHKIRNQIAHEQGFAIQNSELREAVNKLLRYLKQI